MKKLVFVLAARFPTEKAYGVTTELSAETANALGYGVIIATPKLDSTLKSNLTVSILADRLYRLLLSNRIKKFVYLRFSFFIFLYSLNLTYKFKNVDTIFWVRDIFLSYCLAKFCDNSIILEIHRTPKFLERVLLKLLRRNRKVTLAPITEHLQFKLKLDAKNSVVAPMAVKDSELELTRDKALTRRNSIVYLGNYITGPHRLNLDLINQVAHRLNEKYPKWSIDVIGIKEETFTSVCNDVLSNNLNFTSRMDRDKVMEKLRESYLALLLYPDLRYFQDSFPIKIVEYAAAKLAIIASDTYAHRKILGVKRCLYFETDSVIDLFAKIEKLILDNNLRDILSTSAFSWAENLTYENRVRRILQHVANQV
jgi:glycosyltransferase involved in cell wall biosynthesis